MIILGSFFIATGFAFAAGTAETQLKSDSLWQNKSAPLVVNPLYSKPVAPAVTKAVEEPKKETPGQKIKKWVGEHKTQITMGAVGAYVGFALMGTVLGACTFGLGFLLVLAIAAA